MRTLQMKISLRGNRVLRSFPAVARRFSGCKNVARAKKGCSVGGCRTRALLAWAIEACCKTRLLGGLPTHNQARQFLITMT